MLRALLCLFLLFASPVFGRITAEIDETCDIHKNEAIHVVMDRICEMCHEFSSHSQPNMRAECRSECFSTDTFRTCLKLFTPPKRHTRHVRKHAPHHA